MPSIEELLEQAENETSTIEPVNDILEIDPETRTVLIPDSEIIFGVEADQRAERKYFRCPKIVGNNIDLSELEIYVIYQNAGGSEEENRDAYHVLDLEDTGDGYVTFSWELTEKVTRYVGQVSFVVAATRTLSDGTLQNRWSTTIATGKSLIGLQTGMSENEQQQASDLYTQLITELNAKAEIKKSEITTLTNEKKSLLENTGTNQKNLVESEGTKQIQAIENKGTATLATIPEDYTALNTSVNDLKDLMHMKAPAIVEEATSSTEIIVNDSADGMRLQKLNVYGKSWQVSTTGKNLSSIKSAQLSTNVVKSDIVPWTKKNKIYFSCDTENVENLKVFVMGRYYDENRELLGANGALIPCDGTRKSGSFNGTGAGSNGTNIDLTTVEYINLEVSLRTSSTSTSFIDNIMLCDEANIPYEPYTGGKPSPSPDYPQEIQSAGYVLSTGKNLINADEYYSEYKQSDGTYKGKVVNVNDVRISLSEFVGKKVTLSVKATVATITSSVYIVAYIGSEQKRINGSTITSGLTGKSILTITPVLDTDYFIISYGSGNDDVTFSELQLELGSVATSYEHYTGGVPALYQKNIEVKLVGKNYVNTNKLKELYTYENGSYYGHINSQYGNMSKIFLYNEFKSGKSYKFSATLRSDEEGVNPRLFIKYTDGTSDRTTLNPVSVWKYHEVISNANKIVSECYIDYSKGGNIYIKDDISIVEYPTQSLPITTPTGLPAIPVPSGTSGIIYTDADGQAWIADEIDFARGKYIQRVWNGVFDGSEDEVWGRYTARNGWVCNNGLPENMKARNGFCNEKKVGVVDRDEIQLGSKSSDDNKIFYPNSKYYDASLSNYDLSNWKAHLAEQPLKVMTYLDTPIETDLSEEQIQAYKAIHTNKPTTIISNNADAWMGASYAADTKIWIENKIKEIVTS